MLVFNKSVMAAEIVFIMAIGLMVSSINASASCLYCRRADFTATFMVTYSYCRATDECLQDKWLYIDRPCSSGWVRGKEVTVDSCGPKVTTCHSFTSKEKDAGAWTNYTETLGANEYCIVTVDANSFVGRVAFDDATTLGVEYDKYDIGEVISINSGVTNILVFNGDTSGSITFTLAFIQAYQALRIGFLATIALLGMAYYL